VESLVVDPEMVGDLMENGLADLGTHLLLG
jgi:hypothetical protein